MRKAKNVLSNSSANTFTQCQEMYRLSVIEGYTPKVSAIPLFFGSMVHAALEYYWQVVKNYQTDVGSTFDPNVESIAVGTQLAIDEHVTARKNQMLEEAAIIGNQDRIIDAFTNPDSPEYMQPMIDLAKGMMARHAEKYLQDDIQQWQVMEIEWPFRLRLTNTKGQKRVPYDYAGKIDLIARNANDGMVYVFDHKTTAKKPDQFSRDTQLDPQPRGYLWAVEQLLGERPAGFIFNCMRKKLPTVPHVLKVKQSGRALSVAKGIDTTAELFKAAIDQNDPGNDAAYSEMLGYLESIGDTFLWRQWFVTGKDEIDQWLDDRYTVAKQIQSNRRYKNWTRNYQACFSFNRPCVYRNICLLPNAGPEKYDMFDVVKSTGAKELIPTTDTTDDCPF